jgi:hypothetical protein
VLDRMIIDRLEQDPVAAGALQQAMEQGVIESVGIHAIRDQMQATPDETRRVSLVSLYDAVAPIRVGAQGDDAQVEGVGRDEIREAIFAAAASPRVTAVVTEDGELAVRLRGRPDSRCQVCSYADLVGELARAA